MEEFKGKKIKFMCTSKCNINCEHCYISYSGAWDPDELLETIKVLKDKYEILLNGAEVLTNLEYLKSYKEIHQPWIMTNGLALLNKETIKALKDNEIQSVSMSYHFGIHEDISKVTLKTIKRILEILRENDINYRFLTTITSKNYKQIEYMCEEAYKIGAKGIMFTNFIRQGNGQNLDRSLILTQEKINEVFNLINYVRTLYKKEELIIERSGTFGKNNEISNDRFKCNYGHDSVCITPDKNVYPCIFTSKPGFEIGKLIDKKVMIKENLNLDNNVCVAREIYNNNNKKLEKTIKFGN